MRNHCGDARAEARRHRFWRRSRASDDLPAAAELKCRECQSDDGHHDRDRPGIEKTQRRVAEADSDDQSDDGLDHALSSSQSVASDGVDAHQDKEQNPDHEIDDVGHGANLQCDAGLLPPNRASDQYGKEPLLIRNL